MDSVRNHLAVRTDLRNDEAVGVPEDHGFLIRSPL